jgi:hypothetical protein
VHIHVLQEILVLVVKQKLGHGKLEEVSQQIEAFTLL